MTILSASFFVSVSSFFCFFGDVAFSEYFCTITIFSLYGEYVVLNSTFFPSGWCFSTLRPLGLHSFCFLFFFLRLIYESQAFHRQLCSGICYFLVTLLVLHMLFFMFLHPIMFVFLGVKL